MAGSACLLTLLFFFLAGFSLPFFLYGFLSWQALPAFLSGFLSWQALPAFLSLWVSFLAGSACSLRWLSFFFGQALACHLFSKGFFPGRLCLLFEVAVFFLGRLQPATFSLRVSFLAGFACLLRWLSFSSRQALACHLSSKGFFSGRLCLPLEVAVFFF